MKTHRKPGHGMRTDNCLPYDFSGGNTNEYNRHRRLYCVQTIKAIEHCREATHNVGESASAYKSALIYGRNPLNRK